MEFREQSDLFSRLYAARDVLAASEFWRAKEMLEDLDLLIEGFRRRMD